MIFRGALQDSKDGLDSSLFGGLFNPFMPGGLFDKCRLDL